MTTDLVPDLLALYDAVPASPAAEKLRWKILGEHGVTHDCPTTTFVWALTVLDELQQDAAALNLCRQGLMEPQDVSPELGKRSSDWETAEHILTHAIECGQDSLRLAGRAAELVVAS
jgi:hypothetical protein